MTGIAIAMHHQYTTTRRVEFSETDMAGIVHFSNYFRYLESAEHEFFRSLGLKIHTSTSEGMYGWARVHASCDYLAPLRYQDEVEIHLRVSGKKPKSLEYRADLYRVDSEDGRTPVARARWTTVCVMKEPGATSIRSVEMPADVDAAIEVAPNGADTDKDS